MTNIRYEIFQGILFTTLATIDFWSITRVASALAGF